MGRNDEQAAKKASAKFAELVRKFGDTVGEILEDPELRKKAKEFSMAVVDAAANVVETKIKDAEVKSKFHNVGKAAKSLGKSLEDHFKPEQS